MNRTLNTELIKRLRADKGWSQEELAIAADLSARTIQRLETVGSGSLNSRERSFCKAAIFDCDRVLTESEILAIDIGISQLGTIGLDFSRISLILSLQLGSISFALR